MSFLFREPQPLDLDPRQALTEGLGDWQENIRSAYEMARSNDQSFSEGTVLRDQWQPIIEEINHQTDAGFYNPANHLTSGLFTTASEGHGVRQYEHYTNSIFQYIQENKDKLSDDIVNITNEQLLQQGMEQAKFNREQFQEVEARSPGGVNSLARLAGQMGGIGTDPVLFESLIFSGGGSLLAMMLRESLIGAGTEAIAQAGVKDWYESLGYEYTYEDFYQAVAVGGLFGGAAPLAFNVAGKTVSLSVDQAKKGYQAITKSGAFNKTPDLETAEYAARAMDEDMATNPLDDPANEVSASVHEERMEQATVAVENGEAPPMPDQPPIPARPKKTVYDADKFAGVIDVFVPDEIEVDAELFQFKAGGDEFGVTERLQGVTEWNPVLSGQIVVYEYADGRKFIADGHQRLGLAKRIKAQDPSQDVQLLGHNLREIDGITPSMARVMAAVKNVAEGTGTAIDAAKILREAPQRVGELPPKSTLVRQARGLVLLSDDAFGAIVNDVIPANYGALVGRIIEDEALQKTAIGVLAKSNPANEFQAEAILRQIKASDFEIQTQESLFGDELIADSFYLERARVLDGAAKLLRQDKNAFASLNRNAERLEKEGNQLAREANKKRADNDTQAITLIQTAANTPGEISDALTAAAREARETGSYTNPIRGFVETIRQSTESGYFDGLSAGDVGRAFNDPEKSRAFENEDINAVEEFDDPGGSGVQQQADQLEEDLFGEIAEEQAPVADDVLVEARAEDISTRTDGKVDLNALVREINDELLASKAKADDVIPTRLDVDEETGEMVARTSTVKEIQDEIIQDQTMLDRLKGCVE
jgi:hypothetical protein